MDGKRNVQDVLDLQIKTGTDYREAITFQELCNTSDVLPEDLVVEIYHKESQGNGWGAGNAGEEPPTYYLPMLRVIRNRPETDEEYLTRKKNEYDEAKRKEDLERLEYLRLKAKFER